MMGRHHLIELDQQGADEDKLTSKATTFVASCYGYKVAVTACGSLKIMDLNQYGWHASDDGTTLYPTTLRVGVSAAPLTILHRSGQVSCSMFCSCNAGSNCCNEQVRTVAANPAADEADDV